MPEQIAQPRIGGVVFRSLMTLVAVAAMVFAAAMILENYRDHAAGPTQVPPTIGPFLTAENADFDLRDLTVSTTDILYGGAPKDTIPALTDPATISADAESYLEPQDRVIGVVIGGQPRAYPLRVLNWHGIVNDTLGGEKVAVTYCPLCDSAVVFDRLIGERVMEFGVSGLLYKSNVLMFDRGGATERLWSQMLSQRVSGLQEKAKLHNRPLELTTWESWAARYPNTDVLSVETGHDRDYQVHPYAEYLVSQQLMFPSQPISDKMPAKTPVLGAWTGGAARAYPITAFNKGHASVTEEIEGRRITVAYDAESNSLRVQHADDGIAWMYAFWFAWYAFNPDTAVYEL